MSMRNEWHRTYGVIGSLLSSSLHLAAIAGVDGRHGMKHRHHQGSLGAEGVEHAERWSAVHLRWSRGFASMVRAAQAVWLHNAPVSHPSPRACIPVCTDAEGV